MRYQEDLLFEAQIEELLALKVPCIAMDQAARLCGGANVARRVVKQLLAEGTIRFIDVDLRRYPAPGPLYQSGVPGAGAMNAASLEKITRAREKIPWTTERVYYIHAFRADQASHDVQLMEVWLWHSQNRPGAEWLGERELPGRRRCDKDSPDAVRICDAAAVLGGGQLVAYEAAATYRGPRLAATASAFQDHPLYAGGVAIF